MFYNVTIIEKSFVMRISKFIFLALLTTFFTSRLIAQNWSPLPMYGGGYITSVIPHPTTANIVAGVCDVGGVFLTTDGCQTWTSVTASIPKTDFKNFYTRNFAFDPNNSATMYAVTGDSPYDGFGKLWKTTNSGSSWSSSNLPVAVAGNGYARYAGATFLVNPNNSSQLIVAGQPSHNYSTNAYNTNSGVYVSNNGGSTWTTIFPLQLDKSWVTKIAFQPGNTNILYISTVLNTFSGDNTTSVGLWKYDFTTGVLSQLRTAEVLDFAFDAGNSNTIICTSDAGINYTTNGGTSWSALQKPFGLNYGLFATAHPSQSGIWYFGSYDGFNNTSIVTTTDAGANYYRVQYHASPNKDKITYPSYLSTNFKPQFANYMAGLVFNPNDNTQAYMSDWYGVWKTNNANTPFLNIANASNSATNANWNWSFLSQGIHNLVQVRTSLHPTNPDRFWCNVADLHYYESTDAGATMIFDNFAYMNMTTRIDFFKNNTSVGYMCGSQEHGDVGKIVKTTNGGTSWSAPTTMFANGGAYNITDLQLTQNADTVIVGIVRNSLSAQIYRSDNGGSTFYAWDNGLPTTTFFKTWEKNDHLLKDADGRTFYIFRDDKMYRRTLTDAAWTALTMPVPGNWIAGVVPHPTQPKTIFVSQYTSIFKSTNNGTTWTAIAGSSNVGAFAVSNQSSLAYQTWDGSNAHILRISRDNGATWNSLSTTGLYGMIDNLTFLKDHKLLAWNGTNGGFINTLSLVLPLQLVDFKAFSQKDKNLISWKIADARNVKGFDIEASPNLSKGEELRWSKIGSVDFSNNQKNYTFEHILDSFPLGEDRDGALYRLKIIDEDETFEYSKIIFVKRENQNALNIYPNPSKDKIFVIGAQDEPFGIYNAFGQIVKEGFLNSEGIDIQSLASGIYFLKVEEKVTRWVKD
jgi:xyloglucan-specific exo-beta-1,4-glucanase